MHPNIQILAPHQLETFISLVGLFEEVFEMQDFVKPSSEHLLQVLQKPNFFALAAFTQNQLAGGLTGYFLETYYDTRPYAYIFDLAVLPIFQRQGIGNSLLQATLRLALEKNCQEVFVQADRADDHAVSFYRKSAATSQEDVLHFNYTIRSK